MGFPIDWDGSGSTGRKEAGGYILLILMFAVFFLSIGLLIAVPVWRTEIQREKEEELIFRGKQYVEAVRIFALKKPGRLPGKLEELLEEKCIRRLYPDPMAESGEWNVILAAGGGAGAAGAGAQAGKILVAPQRALASIPNARILGVVSSSVQGSIKIRYDQESYDKWLFYYGQDPEGKLPQIVYYGRDEEKGP